MNKAKCLVCGDDISWLKKLASSNLKGIECKKCNSIMRHSHVLVLLSYVSVIVAAYFLGKYLEYSGAGNMIAWLSLVSIGLTMMINAKFILVYENKLWNKNT